MDDSHVLQNSSEAPTGEHDHLDFVAGKIILMQSPEAYINHSCDPNSYVKTIGGIRHVLAMRDTREGEEITYDYATNGDYEWGAECKCGSMKCRKTIVPNFWKLSLERQRDYLPYLDDWFVEKYRDKVAELKVSMG